MKLPSEISEILSKFSKSGFEAYAVGGCVRDLLNGRQPQDWDVTTNAQPEQIQQLFPESFYENEFGTVTVKTGSDNPTLAQIEVTPYRIEGKYSDKRHPDEISFAQKLEDDLSRRDFTVNALALSQKGEVIDLFGGRSDLTKKIIRTVGEPDQRFGEDALRLLRAARLATVLGFHIEETTMVSMQKNAPLLKTIAPERIRDEFVKIIQSDQALSGLELLESTGLLRCVVPELREGIDVEQNLHHIYTVWEHNLRALKYTAEKGYPLEVRLAALFHDIGKPRTKRGPGRNSTFYGHEVVGARMVKEIMARLRFSKEVSDKVTKLVRYHMFYYNVDEVTESSVRRLIANIGLENVEDLIKVREADRIGSGRPKAVPYKLRHLKYIIEKVSTDPISVKMLKVNGNDIMTELGIEPGPKVGLVLSCLLAEVLDDPAKNTREYLLGQAEKLANRTAEDLRAALEKINKAKELEDRAIMEKYHV